MAAVPVTVGSTVATVAATTVGAVGATVSSVKPPLAAVLALPAGSVTVVLVVQAPLLAVLSSLVGIT